MPVGNMGTRRQGLSGPCKVAGRIRKRLRAHPHVLVTPASARRWGPRAAGGGGVALRRRFCEALRALPLFSRSKRPTFEAVLRCWLRAARAHFFAAAAATSARSATEVHLADPPPTD